MQFDAEWKVEIRCDPDIFLRDWCSSWSADLTQKTNHHGIDDDDDDDNNKANMASLDFLLASVYRVI